VIVALLVAGGYAALIWYPVRAAGSVMEPTSADYVEALAAHRAAVDAFPESGELDAATALLDVTDRARSSITEARIALEERTVTSLPVISDRSPIRLAREARSEIIVFYTESQELIGDMEAAAGFLGDVAAVVPSLDNLRAALVVPRSPAEATQVAAAARPIAEQLTADTQALSPTDEMAGVHASLLAIAGRIRADIDELERAAQTDVQQVVTALVTGIREQIETYESAASQAPTAAREAGLEDRIASLETQAGSIRILLAQLADEGVDVTVPEE